jgi:hypothetical protein
VKDEGANLNTLATALTSVVTCDVLGLKKPYSGTCFSHLMSKVCQYGTDSDTVCKSMKHVSMKNAQSTLQKTITWTQKSGKGRQEWEKACIEVGLPSRRLRIPVKTRFASKVVLFQETLEYSLAIIICYQRQSLQLQACIPSGLTWAIARVVCDILNPVVEKCIMNQTRGFWLLSDALVSAMSISLKLQAKNNRREVAVPPLHVGDFDSQLEILYGCISKAGVQVLKPFLDFTGKFNRDKSYNMMAIMLDPRYKGLQSISKFVGPQLTKAIVAQYDKKVLLPLLLKAHVYLNPKAVVEESDARSSHLPEVDQFCLFGAGVLEEEAAEGLLLKELSLFRRLVIDSSNLEGGALEWWRLNEALFPCVGFLARQCLGILGSQIETERIFSVASILTNLRRSRLGLENLNNLIMIYKNWPSDSRTDCILYEHLAHYYSVEAEILEDNEDELAQEGFFEELSDE